MSRYYRNVFVPKRLKRFRGYHYSPLYYYGTVFEQCDKRPNIFKEKKYDRKKDIALYCDCDYDKFNSIVKKNFK